MAYYKNGCNDCGGFSFVTNYSEGDVTCIECGLVQEESMLMDDAYYNFTQNNKEYICTMKPLETTKLSKPMKQTLEDLLSTYLAAFGLDESAEVYKVAKDIFQQVKDKYCFKGSRIHTVVACCVYIAFKLANRSRVARDAAEICAKLGIESSLFAKIMKEVLRLLPKTEASLKQVTENDSIVRQIQIMKEIPLEKVHKLASVVQELDSLRLKHHLMMGTSPMITNAVLIFIAARQLRIPLKKPAFLSYGWVSRATVDKHLKCMMKIM
jgi:transcription initiation factor TFIIIB Brf1 subunit/transcription initiation factor TFIIB